MRTVVIKQTASVTAWQNSLCFWQFRLLVLCYWSRILWTMIKNGSFVIVFQTMLQNVRLPSSSVETTVVLMFGIAVMALKTVQIPLMNWTAVIFRQNLLVTKSRRKLTQQQQHPVYVAYPRFQPRVGTVTEVSQNCSCWMRYLNLRVHQSTFFGPAPPCPAGTAYNSVIAM